MAGRSTTGALGALALLSALAFGAGAANAAAPGDQPASHATFTARVFASGAQLVHDTPQGKESISQPDDITALGRDIFVGFQNGVGPQGQASPTGNRDSTVVEFNLAGKEVHQGMLFLP